MHTLGHLNAIGVREIEVSCSACGEIFDVPISALDLPGTTYIREITMQRALPCTMCSAPGEVVPRQDEQELE